MTKFITYNNTSGEIKKLLEDQSEDGSSANLNVEVDETLLVVSDYPNEDNTYVVGGVLTLRPQFLDNSSWIANVISANGIAEARFGNSLPSNTNCDVVTYIAGVNSLYDVNVTGNAFTFNTTVPGEYFVTFKRFPYQIYTSNITAI